MNIKGTIVYAQSDIENPGYMDMAIDANGSLEVVEVTPCNYNLFKDIKAGDLININVTSKTILGCIGVLTVT